MPEMNKPISIPGALPDDYRLVLHWQVTQKPIRVIVSQLLALLAFILFGLIFSIVAVSLGKLPSQFEFGLGEMGSVLLGILLALGLHELTHGLVMQLFGAKPEYGILWKGLMLYATSPGYAYHRNNYVVILLAPFVVLTTLVILGIWLLQGTAWVALLAICGVFNASGAVGDIWIATIVLKYPTTAYVMDERDGVRVFCKP